MTSLWSGIAICPSTRKSAALLAAVFFLGTAAHAAEVLVAAASDLAPLGPAIEAGFTQATGHHLRFAFGSSSSLAQQIESGAPFDVFLSAGDAYVKNLVSGGHVQAASVTAYGFGRIALWSASASVRTLEDFTRPQVQHVSIANPQHAPYGVAARQALERRGLWSQVEDKLVYADNVRQALQLAESGNADAVVTSWTLLKGRGVLLPSEWHDEIRQTGAVMHASTQPEAAASLLRFLVSPAGQSILTNGGLSPLPSPVVAKPIAPAPKRRRKK